MEFIRRLAVEKERRNNNTAAPPPRVSRSVGHSVNQSTSHHHPSLETIFINKIHNHQSFEPIMHPGGWCTYLCHVLGQRARSHRQRRALRIYRSTILHERINSKSSTNQTNHTNDKPNTAKEHSCVQQQVAVSKKRRCAKPLAHINLPQPDAPKVSNRIGDAISAKPRSEEGETRCAMK